MRQTFMTITCDKCGVQQTFETLNVNNKLRNQEPKVLDWSN